MPQELKNHTTTKNLLPGGPHPLGATLRDTGVNFSIISKYATQITLELFDQPDGLPTDIITLNRTENSWHVFVEGVKAGQLYGFRVAGEYNPGSGKRFNAAKLMMDPYAKAVSGKFTNVDNLIFSYDLNSPEKDLAIDTRDNSRVVPKSIVVDDAFDWEHVASPNIPMEELVIYEVHLKGFTAHSSSKVKSPGTYLGFIDKIPYLKELGINAVEFLPVHEFYVRDELLQRGLTDYWGYNTIGFFAPELSYGTQSAPASQVKEFKTLVKELHKAGIEVILDVVYNHTGEGNELGPTLCFKGVGNPNYYALMQNPENPEEPYRFYKNDSGCGNTIYAENFKTLNMILDSLRYWVREMHVDGFRFDLATIMPRVEGQFSQEAAFFTEIAKDPVLSQVKMIAEPWDLTTYQVGNFPYGWSEWNGKFRDALRRFLKGDDGQLKEVGWRVTGSSDLYQNNGRSPYNSINFITCHDGFTVRDLYSYNHKHNEANLEDNRDGTDDNASWNCGVEGDTDDPQIMTLRKKMIKNALGCLLLSAGTPMMLYGDEMLRTRHGNNNPYCQDNELSWIDWNWTGEHQEIFNFVKKAIAIRKHYRVLERKEFFSGEDTDGDMIPELSWFDANLQTPQWDDPQTKIICYQFQQPDPTNPEGHYYLFFILNASHETQNIMLPQHPSKKWSRLVDTALMVGEDIISPGAEVVLPEQGQYSVQERSMAVLLAK